MSRVLLVLVALVSPAIVTAQSGVPILGSVGSGTTSTAPTYQTQSTFATGANVLTTGNMSITPTTGQEIVVAVATNGTATAITCTDSASNTLSAGATYTGSNPFLYTFYESAPSGITYVVCPWTTTARNVGAVVATTSAIAGQSHTNTGITANGNSTAALVSPTSTHANDLTLSFCSTNANRTWTTSTGNGTVQNYGPSAAPSMAIITNGSGASSGSPVNTGANFSGGSSLWSCAAIELY